MRESLQTKLKHTFEYVVPSNRTVPHLYPEAPEFVVMPEVFATGYFVGLLEWVCIQLLTPHMEEGEGSLGVHINVSHCAPTPPGQKVRVDVECTHIEGRRVSFAVRAFDEHELIGEGTHDRFVVHWDKFAQKVEKKLESPSSLTLI